MKITPVQIFNKIPVLQFQNSILKANRLSFSQFMFMKKLARQLFCSLWAKFTS
jgi:hypothetical protein